MHKIYCTNRLWKLSWIKGRQDVKGVMATENRLRSRIVDLSSVEQLLKSRYQRKLAGKERRGG